MSTDGRRYGYHYTKPVTQFPGVAMSGEEIFGLLVAQKVIAQYRGTPFEQPLEVAFRRLTGQLEGSARFTLEGLDEALSFRPQGPEEADMETFQVLVRGVQERRAVKFRYRNLGAERGRDRQVRPYHIGCIGNHWYLFGFDVGRQGMRTFALTRLTRARLTAAHFEKPKGFKADEYLKGSFGVYKGNDDYEVVLDFDPWGADLIRGRHWHGSQELQDLPKGWARLRLRLSSLEEVEGWVLSWGGHVTVVRPRALAERLRKTAEELGRRYAEE